MIDRHALGFSVGTEIDFFFAGVKIFLVFVCAHFEWVVQIDLISVWGIDLKLIPV